MKLAILALSATLGAGCANPDASTDGGVTRSYNNNDLRLLTSHAAKEMCSCVFVMGQTDDFCRRWVAASPALNTLTVDHGHRVVEAQAVLSWGARAHWVSAHDGCVLE